MTQGEQQSLQGLSSFASHTSLLFSQALRPAQASQRRKITAKASSSSSSSHHIFCQQHTHRLSIRFAFRHFSSHNLARRCPLSLACSHKPAIRQGARRTNSLTATIMHTHAKAHTQRRPPYGQLPRAYLWELTPPLFARASGFSPLPLSSQKPKRRLRCTSSAACRWLSARAIGRDALFGRGGGDTSR